MASKKPPVSTGTSEQLKHNPFAALSGRSAPAALEPAAPKAPEPARAAAPADKPRGRLVLRRETKHRGGKAVVVVSGFEAVRGFDAAAVSELAKRLKQALGCGGSVEQRDGAPEILLQGDQPAKVAELLRAQGFRVDGVTR